jgi:hypothetical protein
MTASSQQCWIDKTHWGAAFRFGHVKVPVADFALIADAMKPT